MLKRLFSVALFFMPCIGTMWASSNRGLLPTPFYNSVGSIQKVESAQAGDFTELKQVVNECRDWATTATTGFAPNAVAELLDKVTLAEMEIASARASQKVIDGYVSSLQSLLRRAKGTINYSPKKVFPVSANHGFVHPGGIVSQGDIDRTKQLLADGDERMTKAWNMLCNNNYSHSDVATYPTATVVRGGKSGQNYMNAARGAAMAYQNALRWKIAGTKENADAAVRILMAWCNGCNGVGGDTNMSLAAGIYGHEFANAAELMRDYEGWKKEDFEKFKLWMVRVWYNKSIDFLRRRHDTWQNQRYSDLGERPGHYWSNWGLCNALCVMSIGILCDDVHMYNQGASFYKYDHVGTFKDRSSDEFVMNDGCNEFIGNLVPVVLPDERGPLGYLGQMQESGRDQGHTLMALGLAVDICQVGFNQGDDLYAYMNDRIAAGSEFVAAMNFGGQAANTLPWKPYDYADCRGTLGSAWRQGGPNTGGSGEKRPYWDRLIGYYEGLRGVKMQYSEKASAAICPDGGGGNYSQNSGGFDHLGFSTLTSWRPAVDADKAIVPLSGDIIYKGVTYTNQTNLGGLKYNYQSGTSKAIPADDADITLMPQLPEGTEDTGLWKWNTGETSRNITVKADHSFVYRVDYTAKNGAVSHQSFAIAVLGDGAPDALTPTITVGDVATNDTIVTVVCGTSLKLSASASTGWISNGYLWDTGAKVNTIAIGNITNSRIYTCQYANQSGAVGELRFHINVIPAKQAIDGNEITEKYVLSGSSVEFELVVPSAANPDDIVWNNGTKGTKCVVDNIVEDMTITATYQGKEYSYTVKVKNVASFTYYKLVSPENGYQIVTSADEISAMAKDHYFVLCSDDADLMIGLQDAPHNGNKALFFQTPQAPIDALSTVFTIEPYNNGFVLRNLEFDDLTLQTELNRADQLRTHDQPLPCEWSRMFFHFDNGAWSIENGKYNDNFLGLWTVANGYRDGEEIACNKKDNDKAHLQLFAISKNYFNKVYAQANLEAGDKDISVLLENAKMTKYTKSGWVRDNNSASGYSENPAAIQSADHNGYGVSHWRSSAISNSKLIYQTVAGLPKGAYTIEAYAAASVWNNNKGDDNRSGVSLFVEANSKSKTTAVTTANYAKYAVDFVNDGDNDLTIGLRAGANNENTWAFLSDVTILYKGDVSNGIAEYPTMESIAKCTQIYDLQGRKVKTPSRGIYIINKRKIVVR